MVDKITMRQWAINAATIIRGYPDLYCLIKRGYDRLTCGWFTQIKKIMEATSPPYLHYPSEAESRGNVLFFAPHWWPVHEGWETMIAHILRRKGFRPQFLICNHAMLICDSYDPRNKRGELCPQCIRDIKWFLELNRLPFSGYSDWIDVEAVRSEARALINSWNWSTDLDDLCIDGFPLGKLVRISLIRFLRRIRLDKDDEYRLQSLDFIESGLLTYRVMRKILQKPWAFLFVINGGFFPEAIMIEMAKQKGIPYFTYERGLKKDYIILCKNKKFMNFDISRIFNQREPLNPEEQNKIREYLEERKFGKKAVVNYWPEVQDDKNEIMKALSLDPEKKIYVAFSNITWDSAVLDREIFFKSLFEWLQETIDFIKNKPDLQLILRMHPAEVRLRQKSSERVADLIREKFPHLSDTIKLVDADSPISSYSLIEMADLVLAFTSTTGLEAAMMGKPVIIAARTHYRGKGFTIDPKDKNQYFQFLENPPSVDPGEIMAISRRYAYTLFFDTHIPFESIVEEDMGFFHYSVKSLDEIFERKFPEVGAFDKFPFDDIPDGFISYRMLKQKQSITP
ncbi:hypothetical protein JW926_14015 [Candidatus Sumerlaeota bacterium]|nr:hypothetical protein [Candidatus Sumerlaeota bacterium]